MNTATLKICVEARPFLSDLQDAISTQRRARLRRGTEPLTPVRRLELIDAGYSHGDGILALSGVSLLVERGEWIGVVGPSGGGKTTLANVLVGLLILLRPVSTLSTTDRRQTTPQLLGVTLRDRLSGTSAPQGNPGREHRFSSRSPWRRDSRSSRTRIDSGRDRTLPDGFDTMVGDGMAKHVGRTAAARCTRTSAGLATRRADLGRAHQRPRLDQSGPTRGRSRHPPDRNHGDRRVTSTCAAWAVSPLRPRRRRTTSRLRESRRCGAPRPSPRGRFSLIAAGRHDATHPPSATSAHFR